MGVLQYMLSAIILISCVTGEILTMGYVNISDIGEYTLRCGANGTYQSNNFPINSSDHFIQETEDKIQIINYQPDLLKVRIDRDFYRLLNQPDLLVFTCQTDGGNIGGIWVLADKNTPDFETKLDQVLLRMPRQHCSLQNNDLVLSCPGPVYWTPPQFSTYSENSIVVSKPGTYACVRKGRGEKIMEFNIMKDGDADSLFCEAPVITTEEPRQVTTTYSQPTTEVTTEFISSTKLHTTTEMTTPPITTLKSHSTPEMTTPPITTTYSQPTTEVTTEFISSTKSHTTTEMTTPPISSTKSHIITEMTTQPNVTKTRKGVITQSSSDVFIINGSPDARSGNQDSVAYILIGVITSVSLLILILGVVFSWFSRKKSRPAAEQTENEELQHLNDIKVDR